jgi:hypothetical protein
MKKSNGENGTIRYLPIFMCIGIGVGMAIGSAFKSIGVGMCLGIGIGMSIGACLDNYMDMRRKNSADTESAAGCETSDGATSSSNEAEDTVSDGENT